MKKQKYIIVGASAAGLAAATQILEKAPQAEVLCFSENESTPSNTCLLTSYCAQKVPYEKLFLPQFSTLIAKGLRYFPATRITSLDSTQRQVTTQSGIVYDADCVVLAMGARPVIPPFYQKMPGVFLFHSLEDSAAVRDWCEIKQPKRAVVIGSGVTGLELVGSLLSFGCHVTVLEHDNNLWSKAQSNEVSHFLRSRFEQLGCTIITYAHVKQLEQSETDKILIYCNDHLIEADIVVMACGVRAETELAQVAGITVGASGIIVNDFLQTSAEHIFAAGDCVEVPHLITKKKIKTSLWLDAVMQGSIAGGNVIEKTKQYRGIVPLVTTHLGGLACMLGGTLATTERSTFLIQREDDFLEIQHFQENILVGFFVSDVVRGSTLRRILQQQWCSS